MAHVYSPKTFDVSLRYFKVELTGGVYVIVTLSYKTKLETAKELQAMIDKENEIIEINETSLTKKAVSPAVYEQTRLKSMRERERLEYRKAMRDDLVYKGESVRFLGYVDADIAETLFNKKLKK